VTGTGTIDVASILDEGLRALQRGDARLARDRLDRVGTDPRAMFPLAQACRALGDAAGAQAALGRLLPLQPGHIAALLMIGDLVADSDVRGACAFYQAALANANASPAAVPATLHPDLRRVRAYLENAGPRYEAHLHARLEAAGIADMAGLPRVAHAIDLLTGKAEVFLQRPSSFYFPGLPQIEFFPRAMFPWLEAVEAASAAMLRELEAVLAGEAFAPYVETRAGRPPAPNPLRDDPSWSACYLWKAGAPVPEIAERCPATMAALASAPMPIIPERSPMALFSKLTPGTHIQPHHGLLNTRLIVHVPLIAPPGAALRVGSQTREWRVGEALVFDDSIEHEAWNRGTRDRTVLLFEIWRPELSAEERAALTVLFGAVGAFVDEGG
jgi:hypothetical protein